MQALPARSSQQTKSWPDKITELKIAAHAKATSSKVLLHVQKGKKTLQKQMRDIHYKNDIIYIYLERKKKLFLINIA